MKLYNFRKESSERSDAANWSKQMLINKTDFFFDGIEGCNQNAQNQTTHLFERAHVDIDINGEKSKGNVLQSIYDLETKDGLKRKINFASSFGLPLSYVLHNDRLRYVFLITFRSVEDMKLERSFDSYEGFGHFLAKIKGWKSTKKFREYDDLPLIDQLLRKNGTPWPTNIDCFCATKEGKPIGIIEYQNAKQIGVLNHSNNDYFLCRQKSIKKTPNGPKVNYHDDIRRWTSQEILRVQSGLPLYVITWSQTEAHYQLKEVKKITFPDFDLSNPDRKGWIRMGEYKEDLHRFTMDPSEADYKVICNRNSFSFYREDGTVKTEKHKAILSRNEMTFPHIYWNRKAILMDDRMSIAPLFESWVVVYP